MKRAQTILIIVTAILLIISFMFLDFEDLGWEANSGNYLGMISMSCVILSMAYLIILSKNKK